MVVAMELTTKNIPIKTTLQSRNYYYFYKRLLLRCDFIECLDKTNICKYSKTTSRDNLSIRRCYNILGVAVDSDQETVRQAFVKLVKRFHPDCGSPEADASRFQEIETAYRKLQEKFSNDRWKHNECLGEYGLYYEEKKGSLTNVKEQDIEHTAPQHRQYLSYGGYGIGTPSQRHRQYQKMRAETAVNNVVGYRVGKLMSQSVCTDEQALVVKDKKEAKKIKTSYGFERLVEDLIQESMARGEFDNLAGQGKPLGRQFDHHNPYVDLVTQKLNQVLIDNGFKPEWITLQKEISNDTEDLRQQLSNIRSKFGPIPLNEEDRLNWEHSLLNLYDTVNRINKKITKYNLVVPLLTKQMIQISLKKEAEKILKNGKPVNIVKKQEELINQQPEENAKALEKSSLMGLLPIFVIAYFYFYL